MQFTNPHPNIAYDITDPMIIFKSAVQAHITDQFKLAKLRHTMLSLPTGA